MFGPIYYMVPRTRANSFVCYEPGTWYLVPGIIFTMGVFTLVGCVAFFGPQNLYQEIDSQEEKKQF